MNHAARRMKSRETSCSLADLPSWGARLCPFAAFAAFAGARSRLFIVPILLVVLVVVLLLLPLVLLVAASLADEVSNRLPKLPPRGMSHIADAANTTTVTHHALRTPPRASAYDEAVPPSSSDATDFIASAHARGITAERVNAPDKVADAAPWYSPKSIDMLCMHSWTPAPIPRRK